MCRQFQISQCNEVIRQLLNQQLGRHKLRIMHALQLSIQLVFTLTYDTQLFDQLAFMVDELLKCHIYILLLIIFNCVTALVQQSHDGVNKVFTVGQLLIDTRQLLLHVTVSSSHGQLGVLCTQKCLLQLFGSDGLQFLSLNHGRFSVLDLCLQLHYASIQLSSTLILGVLNLLQLLLRGTLETFNLGSLVF